MSLPLLVSCSDTYTDSTRCTCSLLGHDPKVWIKSNSVGAPNANTEAMVVDENTNEEITARGTEARGELWVRGMNVRLVPFSAPDHELTAFDSGDERLLAQPQSHLRNPHL